MSEHKPSPTQSDLADKLLRVLSGEMMLKAEMFDYLCWLNQMEQSQNVKGVKYLVMASDGTTCWGNTYAEAARVAMAHDKEMFDAYQQVFGNPP